MTNSRLFRVLDSATARLAGDGADAHRLSMAIAAEALDTSNSESEDHAGAAYVLWMEISDLVDAPDGPQSPELCRTVAERAAAAWDSVDQSDPARLADYFTRWRPRDGDSWLSAQNLS
jgi:hypothetical protein